MNTIRFYDKERDDLMTSVERGIRSFCFNKKLFAWEEGIDDCLSMVAVEMCRRNFKDNATYYTCIGKQLMISMARDKSCIKRRVNFDFNLRVNIDDRFDVGACDEHSQRTFQDKGDRIIREVQNEYGEEVARYVEGLIRGTSIKDKRGNEMSEARIALKIKNLFRGKDIGEFKELIKSFENE